MKKYLGILGASFLFAGVVGACAETSNDESSMVEQAASTASSGSVTATLETTSSWTGGFCQSVTIKNTGAAVTNWTLKVATGGATISSIWSASQTTSGTTMTVTPTDYNRNIPSNGSINFGFCGSGNTQPTLTSISVTGGSTGTGGASSVGGSSAKGGTSSVGGTTAKGGTSSVGGTTAKGGTSSVGGTTAKGGSTGTAGSPPVWATSANVTVNVATQKQYIRGYGGMNHPVWAGDLTAAQRTLAFANGTGQLGFSVLRIWISDNSNDWSKEVATAKAAIANGAIVFATPWNPPASMKTNGAINPSKYADYANHLNSFVSYMKGQGVDIYAVAVQNEPDYASEWTKWTQAQCHDFIRDYGAKISTRLISCESFNYTKSYYDPILNDASALQNMDILGTHLYGTQVSSFPYSLYDQKGAGKERWMTEHYTDSTTDADAWPNALNVATELHNSMVKAQFNLYTWWYIRRSYGPIKESGAVSKRGWCMAHWSKFVRPGAYRVDATETPTSGVLVSAYKSGTDVVVVAVNQNTAGKSVTVTVPGANASFDKYTTSSSKSLASDGKVTVANGVLTVSLDASSVTTLRGTRP
ncbi:MAG: cellulose binding domain-containing protein [Polyangiaceae bacterium]